MLLWVLDQQCFQPLSFLQSTMNKPSITFYGGVGNVTGANFLVSFGSSRVLVDCGIVQGVEGSEQMNADSFPYEASIMNALCVTHAHMDHIGRIPKLVKDGFRGVIWSTPETRSIARVMLQDAVKILERNAKEQGILPMYGEEDVEKAFSLWKVKPYHESFEVAQGISASLFDAGHILGSSMYRFTFADTDISLLCTGDLGNSPSLLVRDTEIVSDVNYVLMDSVYGDRNHEPKEERDARFLEEIKKAIDRKGTLLIPAFSLERTQAILYQLNNLVEDHTIPSIPVFLDSPLAIRLMDIYESITSLYNEHVQKDIRDGDKIFNFPRLKETARVEESKVIHKTPGPKIIIAGSGMSTAGRILHHEIEYLPDPNATILLMGYQAPGTLGRQISEGVKNLVIDDIPVEVKAHVVQIGGYSGHKDSQSLLEFVKAVSEGPLKKVFIAMGEMKSATYLAQKIRAELGLDAVVPQKGDTVTLE